LEIRDPRRVRGVADQDLSRLERSGVIRIDDDPRHAVRSTGAGGHAREDVAVVGLFRRASEWFRASDEREWNVEASILGSSVSAVIDYFAVNA
jgi:hypothetical protein